MRTIATMKFEPQPCRARMNQPSCDLVIEDLQAIPCFFRGRHAKESEENASDELKHQDCERSAAKFISPACRLARDGVLHCLADRRRERKPLIEPVAHFSDQAHGGL